MKNVMVIFIKNRKDEAERVQKILTGWGCLIKVRLGIHDGVLDNCSDEGLLFLELVGEEEKQQELCRKLNLLKGVEAKLMTLGLEAD